MIIARTPFRISFFGGGTDYPEWYRHEGGAVLSTTIDKYCYLSLRYHPPFFPTKHRVVWSHVETVGSIAEILHPAVREGMRMLGFDDRIGVEVHHQGDLPARAGMGSSSAFAVGLIQGLTALRGQMIDKHELAMRAIDLEHEWLRQPVGSQDQMACAHGGFNRIEFGPGDLIRVDPVTVAASRLEALQARLLLFYTGTSRLAAEVAADVVDNLARKAASLRRMRAMVDEALAVLNGDDDLDRFGRLLHETWMLKRGLGARVASRTVEDVYRRAMKHGALGGKLLGAGSSGFMVFYVPPKRQEAVVKALAGYLHVPFGFEREGSRIIYYAPGAARWAGREARPTRGRERGGLRSGTTG